MVGVVLRKLLCTHCYYYGKWCGIGWGKLAALFFKPGHMEDFNNGMGQRIAPLTYGILSLVPIILLIISMFQGFSIFKVIVLLLLILISVYSGTISRKGACTECKMRYSCRGCAVKQAAA